MTGILTAAEARRLDESITRDHGIPSRTLMERAAAALVRCLTERTDLFPRGQVLVLCGGGNNGGDGFAAARQLACGEGCVPTPVAVLYLGRLSPDGNPDTTRMSAECAHQYHRAVEAGVPIYPPEALDSLLPQCASVLDAVFGIGLQRPIEGVTAQVLASIDRSGLPVLAADLPSGVSADSGEVLGVALRAAMTVTMFTLKPGLLLYPGADLCGEIAVADLGAPPIEESILGAGLRPYAHLADEVLLRHILPPRPRRTHKGDYGRLSLVCGSVGMAGAAALVAEAALRSGVGLARVITPEGNRTILQTSLPEAVLTLYGQDAPALPPADGYVVGCGLGQSAEARQVLEAVLSLSCPVPTVLDADALNLIAAHPELWNAPLLTHPERCIVLTPHPAEMARLTGRSVSDILRDLPTAARTLAAQRGVTVVLKDAHTVVATPDGELYISIAGNAGMAKGGSGDLLAGIIGSLLTQCRFRMAKGKLSPAQVAAAGVYLHGAAGDLAAERLGEYGMFPSDILRMLPEVTRAEQGHGSRTRLSRI